MTWRSSSADQRPSRRRFLAIAAGLAAAGLAGGTAVQPVTRWRGIALGARAEISLRGPDSKARRALVSARRDLRRAERLFSLFDPFSALSVLNRNGVLSRPPVPFLDLLMLADRIHAATGGRFDPTVQPLWLHLASLKRIQTVDAAMLDRLGWDGVRIDPAEIRFARSGMALTLNGIAQGYATDMVSRTLALEGFTDILVNIGEFRAGPASWTIGVADPLHGPVACLSLASGAVATSSPAALPLAGGRVGHILDPRTPFGPALWSTVSVQADSAAVADGFSTAMTLMPAPAVRRLLARARDLREVLLVSADVGVHRITRSPPRSDPTWKGSSPTATISQTDRIQPDYVGSVYHIGGA